MKGRSRGGGTVGLQPREFDGLLQGAVDLLLLLLLVGQIERLLQGLIPGYPPRTHKTNGFIPPRQHPLPNTRSQSRRSWLGNGGGGGGYIDSLGVPVECHQGGTLAVVPCRR
jgi:hypothetical protein